MLIQDSQSWVAESAEHDGSVALQRSVRGVVASVSDPPLSVVHAISDHVSDPPLSVVRAIYDHVCHLLVACVPGDSSVECLHIQY